MEAKITTGTMEWIICYSFTAAFIPIGWNFGLFQLPLPPNKQPSLLNMEAAPEVCDATTAENRIEAGDIKLNLTITFKTVDIIWPDS